MSSKCGDFSLFKVPIPSSLYQKNNGLPLHNPSSSSLFSSGSSTSRSATATPSLFGGFSSKRPQGNGPIPSTLYNGPSLRCHEIGRHGLATSALWGRSGYSRSIQEAGQCREYSGMMPPPQAPRIQRGLFPTVGDESSIPGYSFENSRKPPVHSTPLHRPVPLPKNHSIMGPLIDSGMGHPAWSRSITSRNNESVRSFASTTTEYIDKVFTRALHKLFETRDLNHEARDLAMQVGDEIRRFAHEAAQEMGPAEGSIRSHYSRKASSVRSYVTGVSDHSRDALNSLLKSGRSRLTPALPADLSPPRSEHCSMVRTGRKHHPRITEEHVPEFITSSTMMERVTQPRKRSRSPGSDNSTDECHVPQTVRRRKLDSFIPDREVDDVQEFGSPKRTVKKWKKAKRAFADNTVRMAEPTLVISDTPCVRKQKPGQPVPPSEVTSKSAKPHSTSVKQPCPAKKADGRSKATTITMSAKVTVTLTRSGRNVKRPSYYQVDPKKKTNKQQFDVVTKPKGESAKPQRSKCMGSYSTEKACEKVKNVSKKAVASGAEMTLSVATSTGKNVDEQVEKAAKVSKKTAIRKRVPSPESTDLLKDPPLCPVRTRCGRTVKQTNTYGNVVNFDNSLEVPLVTKPARSRTKKPTKENVPPKPNPAKNSKRTPDHTVTSRGENPLPGGKTSNQMQDNDSGDLSFGDIDFFIPTLTESTRRAGKKNKLLKSAASLGAQTPPLHYFTENLHPHLVSTVTPTQQTPDWQISQRTQSELKEFKKRKLQAKPKKPEKLCPAKQPRRQKRTKAIEEAMKLVLDVRAPTAASVILPAPSSSESDGSESD